MTHQNPPPNLKGRKVSKVNHRNTAIFVELLMHGDHTYAELAEDTGLHILTVGALVRAFLAHGTAYIAGWAPDAAGRMVLPLVKLGKGKNVPRPKPKSKREIKVDGRRRAANRQLQSALSSLLSTQANQQGTHA